MWGCIVSNFDFLGRSDFIKFPSCRVLYENARLAESMYYSDHEKCAVQVRFVLEQFCILVGELKHAVFPDAVFAMECYWNPQNIREFTGCLGDRNVTLLKEAYRISDSFLQSDLPTREDIYPEMLRNVYILLLWLFRELGLETTLSEKNYRVGQIPRDSATELVTPHILYSSAQDLAELKHYFPKCNTGKVNGTWQFQTAEATTEKNGEEDLRKQMQEVKRQFDFKTREYIQNRSACDSKISALEKQIANVGQVNTEHGQTLNQEISGIKKEKAEATQKYRGELAAIGSQFDVLKDRYEAIRSTEIRQKEMQQQMKSALTQRAGMKEEFEGQQKKLLEKVQHTEDYLKDICQKADLPDTLMQAEELVAGRFVKEITQKRNLIKRGITQAQQEYTETQKRSAEVISQYQNRINKMEIILMQIQADNMRYQEFLVKLDSHEEIKEYLEIIVEGIKGIDTANAIFQNTPSAQEWTKNLLKVKEQYEKCLREFHDKLRERKREAAWEKKRYEDLLNSLYVIEQEEEQNVSDKDVQETKGENMSVSAFLSLYWKEILVVVLCLLLGILISWAIHRKMLSRLEVVSKPQDIQQMEEKAEKNQKGSDTSGEKQLTTDLEDEPIEQFAMEEANGPILTSYRQIENLSEKLLREIDQLDFDAIAHMTVHGARGKKDNMTYVGKGRVPVLVNQGNSLLLKNPREMNLGAMDESEAIQFAYVASGEQGVVIVAVDIVDLGGLDADSSVEDVNALMGGSYDRTFVPDQPTDYSSAEREYLYLYCFTDPKEKDYSKKVTGAIVPFDEEGKICDYVYIAIYNKVK